VLSVFWGPGTIALRPPLGDSFFGTGVQASKINMYVLPPIRYKKFGMSTYTRVHVQKRVKKQGNSSEYLKDTKGLSKVMQSYVICPKKCTLNALNS
jgi:hypothetical protein